MQLQKKTDKTSKVAKQNADRAQAAGRSAGVETWQNAKHKRQSSDGKKRRQDAGGTAQLDGS